MPNIEIKAKCSDLAMVRSIADKLKTADSQQIHQIDTYFATKAGRLKLREIDGKTAQLIPYIKDYSFGPMKSNYSVLAVTDSKNLKSLLRETLGEIGVIDKTREVFLLDNIRVHLDQVKGLGSFIEFEAVYEEGDPELEQQETVKVNKLLEVFNISKEDLLDKSYIDYLL